MKSTTKSLLLIILITICVNAQTTHRYYDSFDINSNPGWASTSSTGNFSVNNGQLNLTGISDDLVHMLLPIGATKDDFSFKIVGGTTAEGVDAGGFGRMGFKSLIALNIEDDSISVIYSNNIQSYNEPNFTWLKTHPLPSEVNSIQLNGVRSGNNLVISAYVNDILFYNGTINNADPGLFEGQLVVYLGKGDDPVMNWSLAEVDVHYTPIEKNNNTFTEEFTDVNAPWFRFGDFDNLAQSLTINNGRLNFNYNGTSEPWLYVISPFGSVKEFTLEVEGGGGNNHNAPFEMSRFFDSKNYITMFLEDDTVHIGYAINSVEPVIINRTPFPLINLSRIKFGISGEAPNLTVNVWINNNLVSSANINNATDKLNAGHLALGYSRGNMMDAYIERSVIVGVPYSPPQYEFLDHVTNNMTLSVFPDGLLGQNKTFDVGNSLKYLTYNNLLFSGGLIYGNSTKGATGMIGSFNFYDLLTSQELWTISPGTFFDTRYRTSYTDVSSSNSYGVEVMQESFSASSKDIVFLKYLFKNVSGSTLLNFYIGLIADFDIVNYATNLGGYDVSKKLVYQYDFPSQIHLGLVALSGFSGGKVTTTGGGRADIYDFMRGSDYTTPPAGGDNRSYISTGAFNIANNGEAVAAFAIVTGNSLANLLTNTDEAISIYNSQLIGVDENESIVISDFSLSQNYPNPFNPSTRIKFAIPVLASNSLVTIKVYDVMGREVTTLVNEQKPTGEYEVIFNGSELSSGVYFYQLTVGSYFSSVKKLLLMK
ncbi:MAG: T9SS type A sorting domain-containing protein [Ignavibacteria bacterium]|nr:T9SS type A sorting domain-containing protein [Ignavibacteria bacterium]